MRTSVNRSVLAALIIPLICTGSASAAGIAIGQSGLIGTLDYSDTFTGTDDGGRPNRPYIPAVQPASAYLVENTYGKPQVSFDIGAGFSFAADRTGTPGLVNGSPAYPLGLAPNASGAGSATGFTQTICIWFSSMSLASVPQESQSVENPSNAVTTLRV